MGGIKGFISKHPVGAGLVAAAGVITVAFKMASKTIRKWDNEMSQMQKRISAFNADAAMGEITLMLGNMRRTMGEAGIFGKTTRLLSEMKDRIADNIQPLKNMATAFKTGPLDRFYSIIESISVVIHQITVWLTTNWEKIGPALTGVGRGMGWAMMGISPGLGLLNIIIAEGFEGINKHVEELKKEISDQNTLQGIRDNNQDLLGSMEALTAGAWSMSSKAPAPAGKGRGIKIPIAPKRK
jgi:methyl-accepting chemotaxis protein